MPTQHTTMLVTEPCQHECWYDLVRNCFHFRLYGDLVSIDEAEQLRDFITDQLNQHLNADCANQKEPT